MEEQKQIQEVEIVNNNYQENNLHKIIYKDNNLLQDHMNNKDNIHHQIKVNHQDDNHLDNNLHKMMYNQVNLQEIILQDSNHHKTINNQDDNHHKTITNQGINHHKIIINQDNILRKTITNKDNNHHNIKMLNNQDKINNNEKLNIKFINKFMCKNYSNFKRYNFK